MTLGSRPRTRRAHAHGFGLAPDAEAATALAEELIAANIKRGWVRVDG